MPRPLAVLPLPPVSASLASEAGLGKARCWVWLRVAAPRFAPPYVSGGGRGPSQPELWRCQDLQLWLGRPFAYSRRAQCWSCCLLFSPCSGDGTVQLGEWEDGHHHLPIRCSYWAEMFRALSLKSAVECSLCCDHGGWGGTESH